MTVTRPRLGRCISAGFALVLGLNLASLPATAAEAPASETTASETVVLTFMSVDQYATEFDKSRAEASHTQLKAVPAGMEVQSGAELRDPPSAWYLIGYSTQDWDGRDWPTRQGTSAFGREHFNVRHNLYNPTAVMAPYHGYPDVEDGTHLEYLGVLSDGYGNVYARIRTVGEENETTSDGAYTSPDGRPIGTITAYCEGVPNNVCPDIVNQV